MWDNLKLNLQIISLKSDHIYSSLFPEIRKISQLLDPLQEQKQLLWKDLKMTYDNLTFRCACWDMQFSREQRTARINVMSEIFVFSLNLGFTSEIYFVGRDASPARLLRRPKMFFRETGTRTSDILLVTTYIEHTLSCADFRPSPREDIPCRSRCFACATFAST